MAAKIRFEALQARYGDCLFLTFEGAEGPVRLLVDGGPSGVFRTSLKPRLDLEAPPGEPLAIDAVMISHIDEDHILGILDLFGALQDADQRHAPWPYRPRWLLHNSFDSLIGEGDGSAARAIGGETVLAAFGTGPLALTGPASADQIARDVLASYGQGSRLATMAAALHITRNPPDQQTIMFDAENPRVLRMGGATLRILGPLADEVADLRREWTKWKVKQTGSQQERQENTASLAAYLDTSVPNLSSIVALIEAGDRRVLITGDARGDHILAGLKRAGLWTEGDIFKVDVLKLPHHGSSRNIDVDLFQAIHADHYVVSGDGTYSNPDRETLAMLATARPEGGFTLHLTYDAASCDRTNAAWLAARGKPFEAGRDGIADMIEDFRATRGIAVEEGPVSLSLA